MSDDFRAIKAPLETLDFAIDWSVEMAKSNPVDAVSSSAWTLEDQFSDNLTIVDPAGTIEGMITVVRVEDGGRLGTRHYLTNRIVTAGGQRHQRTILVTMRSR